MHTSPEVLKLPEHLKDAGKVISPIDYKNYQQLLEETNPTIICFLALEDTHQVGLNAIAKERGIRTFHIEHGVRDRETSAAISAWKSKRMERPQTNARPSAHIWRRIALRRVLSKSLRMASSALRMEIDAYMKFRNAHDIHVTARDFCGSVHLPTLYINFSPAVFDFHRSACVAEEQEVVYIGHPGFDTLADMSPSHNRKLFFIDQPFVEWGLFGWTEAKKKAFIMDLVDIAIHSTKDGHLYVKKHPYSDSSFWSEFDDRVEIVEMKDLSSNGIYIGFASTLLIPLAAKEDSLVISMQNHPSIDFAYGEFLLKDGAISPIEDTQSLRQALANLEELQAAQQKKKASFMQKWMTFDDGRSKERLAQHLLS